MMSGEAGWLRSPDVLAHEIYNNTRPAPVMLITLQHTCSTLHYITVQGVTADPLRAGKKGKFWFPSLNTRRRRVHFWVASNKQ